MFKNILLAYDGSECANHAADVAGELAKKFDSHIMALYAFRPIPKQWSAPLREQALEQEITQGKMLLGGVVERLEKAGVRVESRILEGLEHDVIVKTARAHDMDLIVIGSRGTDETTSFLLGSVTDRVVHRARCPVLVVR